MKINQSLFAVVGALIIPGAIYVTDVRAQSGASSAAAHPGPKKAEEQFKNIQIFKRLPADQLIPAMQFITASLGVECQFCHVEGAFEKDDKKTKLTARKMMEMMIAINADNFDGEREVTCNTCHRGSPMPVSMPPVMSEEVKATEAKRTNPPENKEGDGPEARENGASGAQLLDRYLQAVGGAPAIEKVNTRVMKGTITFGDREVPIDIFSKDPDMRVSFTHTPDGDNTTGFDGHQGWLGVPGKPVREMHGPDVDAASLDADLRFPEHLKNMFSEARVRGAEKIGDHDTSLLVGERDGKTPLRLYFDVKSGLLIRMVRFGETPLGRLPTQIDYADYREVGGVKIPFRWTLARPGGRFTIQLTEVKQNVPVDDAKFTKPAGPEPQQNTSAK